MQTRLPRLFTVRFMVFGCVVLLAFILVSPTLHSYVQQRQQLAALRAQVATEEAHNDNLKADLERWDDPAYVQAQARQRLSFVMPGEKAFRVVDPETVPDVAPADKPGPSAALDDTATGPWYQAVWASVEAAGTQPAKTSTDATSDPRAATKPDADADADSTKADGEGTKADADATKPDGEGTKADADATKSDSTKSDATKAPARSGADEPSTPATTKP